MKKKLINDIKIQKALMRDKLQLSIKQGEEGKIVLFTVEEFMKFPK